jgi:hypothetical protein
MVVESLGIPTDASQPIAIASLVIAVIAAAAVVYREWLHSLIFKPDLRIEFSLDAPISRDTLIEWSSPSQLPINKKAFWPRIRVTNKGRTVARKCEGILAEVRNPDGTLDNRYDPLILRWAIAPINRGLEPLDIAQGRQVDLNTFTTIDGETNAPFATFPDPRGIPLHLDPGDHWLRIVIYGDNFPPVEIGYAVHWDGKDYKNIAMKEMKQEPTDADTWPFKKPLLLEEASKEPPATESRGTKGKRTWVSGIWKPIVVYILILLFVAAIWSGVTGGISLAGDLFGSGPFWAVVALGCALVLIMQYGKAILVLLLLMGAFLLFSSFHSPPYEELGNWVRSTMDVSLYAAALTVLALAVAVAQILKPRK